MSPSDMRNTLMSVRDVFVSVILGSLCLTSSYLFRVYLLEWHRHNVLYCRLYCPIYSITPAEKWVDIRFVLLNRCMIRSQRSQVVLGSLS